jgi:hypothetical protein
MVAASDITDIIKQCTKTYLQEINVDISAKLIVISAEFTNWPNFTIIDTPALLRKLQKRR